MKRNIAIIMVFIAFILDPFLSSLFPKLFSLNLEFCLMVLFAIASQKDELMLSIVIAILLSVPVELFSNQFTGASAISMIVVFLGIVGIKRHINLENTVFLIILTVSASFIYQLVYWGIYKILGSTYGFLYMFIRLPLAVLPNAFIMMIMLLIFNRYSAHIKREGYFRARKW